MIAALVNYHDSRKHALFITIVYYKNIHGSDDSK